MAASSALAAAVRWHGTIRPGVAHHRDLLENL
jgi:hypothetical protein